MKTDYKKNSSLSGVSAKIDADRVQVEIAMSLDLMERSREIVSSMLTELGRLTLNTLLEASAEQVAGPRSPGVRNKPGPTRHGYEAGSLRFGVKKVPVRRPRLREANQEVDVPLYEQLRRDPELPGKVHRASVNGLSTRRVEPVLESVGLKKSQVSRHLVSEMESHYQTLMSRKIERRMLVVMLDGIHLGDHVILTAVGIDEAGDKHILGIREGATENSEVCKSLLSDLIERGLRADLGMLFVLDGSKALSKAVKELFPHSAVQRCRVHKLRNVLDHVPETKKAYVRAAMRSAWKLSPKEGIRRMEDLAKELSVDHPGACSSLREGIEETFTLNRMDLPALLIPSLSSTNIIENCHGAIGQCMRRISRVQDGKMALRWAASALLEAEPNMRNIKGGKYLWMLKAQLDNEPLKKEQSS